MTSEDLHARRVSAVRAWTRFVEDGDGEADVVRPEILRSWQLSEVVSPGVTQAPLTSAVITMELTDNHEFVLPIIAACLLGRAFSTLLCTTPVYRAFARRAVEARERELAAGAG